MARPVDIEQKRALILDGARKAFTARGYHKATVDDVAAAAGIAKGTVYLYFKTKKDLADGLLDAHFTRLEQASKALREIPATPAALREVLSEILTRAPLSADVVRIYFEMLGPELAAGESPLLDRARGFFDSLTAELKKVLARLQKEGLLAADIRPAPFARLVVTALDGLILHQAFFQTPPRDYRQAADELMRMIK